MGKDDGSHEGSETVAEAVDKLDESHTVDRPLKQPTSTDARTQQQDAARQSAGTQTGNVAQQPKK